MDSIPDLTDRLAALGIRQAGDEVLTKLCSHVPDGRCEAPLIAELSTTLNTIRGWYRFRNGFGIAAPQIGSTASVIVFGTEDFPMRAVVNPVICWASDDRQDAYEGCLSCWSVRGMVSRSRAIKLRGRDAGGEPVDLLLEGSLARIAQHEYDHLLGILYTQRMRPGAALIGLPAYARIRDRVADSSASP